MAGPADDIKRAVKSVGLSDPMAQIGSALDRAGQAISDGAAWARDKVKGAVEQTPHGTTRGATSKDAEPRKRIKKIHVQPTANNGFVVTHHYQPEYGGTPAPDRHAFTDYDTMHAHVASTMTGRKDD